MTTNDKALTKPGGFGGLGDFTTESLLEVAKNTESTRGSATGDEIRDAMGNVRPTLDTVKVKGHGANLFLFPDDTKVDGDVGLTGVIVAFTRHNTYFGKPFDQREEGEMPPCFSNDGETVAENAEGPMASVCSECPRNRDAKRRDCRDEAFELMKSEGPGSGKICNNYLSIALALPGKDIPVRIRFTRQSFKAWAEYVQRIGTEGRYLPHEIVTHVTLRNEKGQKAEFSVGNFRPVRKATGEIAALPDEMRDEFARQRTNYRALLQRTAEADDGEAEASEDAKAAVKGAQARARKAAESGDAGL